MKLSCSPSFVTAVYSRLTVLSPSKQELGGTAQQSALHRGLHISSRLCFWEYVSCHLVLVWRGLDTGEADLFQRLSFTHSVSKAQIISFPLWVLWGLQVHRAPLQLFICRSFGHRPLPDTRSFVTKPIYVSSCKMDGVALQAERR